MAYIRTNEDYDRSLGIDPTMAKDSALRELRAARADPGYCNPFKAKRLAEAEEEARALGVYEDDD